MTERNSRQTRQKEAVRRVLRAQSEFVSAQELHELLVEAGEPVGLATVYRQLSSLAKNGSVDTIEHKGSQLYRLCAAQRRHHHHLVCESCGKTVEIEPPREDWLRAVAAAQGFTVASHTLEVYGLCSDCQRKERQAGDSGRPPQTLSLLP
ncbi:Ferric uptake regulation protein [Bifidobacterium actinocoloniiforme DSM 22766]|uniref:Ferric uptake regulation protein n=1 Tax=Bifidobacterium actinocoloniiforme DSM 22766 TaxID=1437605 RepID=A0A086Z1F1_9BIFI|nr:Fur family transcriptional regulator [Bifidobacterium actinocoloniiforme]AKV55497.1 peptide ABC transporter substrate-binding protein [Bifidobacterium actinocoloniiforme DSM 22766]KFI40351.1 Ferric uptake regulation protein [Bifidobacterium actinocoloniiforme DSM 22766]